MWKLEGSRTKCSFWCSNIVSSRVSGFPVASPCLWGKLQNLSCFKVSQPVVTWFCVRGVTVHDILMCLQTCRKSFCVAGVILWCSFQKMSCIFPGKRSTLETSIVILRGTRSTSDVSHYMLYTPDSTLHIPHFTLYTPHFTFHTLHSTLCTPHSTLHALHSTLHASHSTICTSHSPLHTPNFTLHTLHFTLYTPHFTLHTLHSTLDTPHFTLHTPHFTLHTPHFTLHTPRFTLYIRFTLHTPNSTLYTPHSTLYTLHFTLHTLHSTLHTLHFALHTPHFTLHTLHFTLYTLHFTLHTLHSTLHTLHFALHTLHFTLHTLHFTLYSFTLHTLHFTLYTLHSTLYTPHFTLYTLNSTLCSPLSSAFHSLQCTGTVTGEKCTRLSKQLVSQKRSTWLHSGSWAASCCINQLITIRLWDIMGPQLVWPDLCNFSKCSFAILLTNNIRTSEKIQHPEVCLAVCWSPASNFMEKTILNIRTLKIKVYAARTAWWNNIDSNFKVSAPHFLPGFLIFLRGDPS